LTETEERRRNAAASLAGAKVDALLVSSPASVRYLTDYAGSNGLLLITPSEAHFFTDPRYASEASRKLTCKVHIAKRALIQDAAALAKRQRIQKLGFEPSWLNFGDHQRLKDGVGLGCTLLPVNNLVEDLRMIKSPAEISLIRRSVNVNSEAFIRTLRRIRPGHREQEIAAELDYQMRVLGAEKPSFDTIMAAGARAALPHAHPGAHRLTLNELLLIDMGATLDGYASDMTRVAYLGTPPRPIRQMYRAVLEAQQAAMDTVREGVAASSVDAAARNVLKRHKLDKAFVHSTGHGLGLEIHEAPRIGRKEKTKLRAGMTITIEPGAYVDGLGGIRIEDTVLVTESGCQVLTPTPKDFFEI
jgi:Xaa-Pro aminopeptidase